MPLSPDLIQMGGYDAGARKSAASDGMLTFNRQTNRHFYTTSPNEARSMVNGGWHLEGNAGQLYNEIPAGTNLTALYRLLTV